MPTEQRYETQYSVCLNKSKMHGLHQVNLAIDQVTGKQVYLKYNSQFGQFNELEAAASEFYRYCLGPHRAPQVRAVISQIEDGTSVYVGTASDAMPFVEEKTFTNDLVADLTKKGIGSLLATNLFMEEEDCHDGNFKMVRTGSVNYEYARIDFDRSLFSLVADHHIHRDQRRDINQRVNQLLDCGNQAYKYALEDYKRVMNTDESDSAVIKRLKEELTAALHQQQTNGPDEPIIKQEIKGQLKETALRINSAIKEHYRGIVQYLALTHEHVRQLAYAYQYIHPNNKRKNPLYVKAGLTIGNSHSNTKADSSVKGYRELCHRFNNYDPYLYDVWKVWLKIGMLNKADIRNRLALHISDGKLLECALNHIQQRQKSILAFLPWDGAVVNRLKDYKPTPLILIFNQAAAEIVDYNAKLPSDSVLKITQIASRFVAALNTINKDLAKEVLNHRNIATRYYIEQTLVHLQTALQRHSHSPEASQILHNVQQDIVPLQSQYSDGESLYKALKTKLNSYQQQDSTYMQAVSDYIDTYSKHGKRQADNVLNKIGQDRSWKDTYPARLNSFWTSWLPFISNSYRKDQSNLTTTPNNSYA